MVIGAVTQRPTILVCIPHRRRRRRRQSIGRCLVRLIDAVGSRAYIADEENQRDRDESRREYGNGRYINRDKKKVKGGSIN